MEQALTPRRWHRVRRATIASLATLLACAALAPLARADDHNPASLAPTTPPADAQRLPSGVMWKTLAPGTGTAHPGPHDWVALYGGTDRDNAMLYYMAQSTAVDQTESFVAEALPQMRVGEKRRFWTLDHHVRDVELAAILGPTGKVDFVVTAPPSDAQLGASGLRSVVLTSVASGRGRPGNDADLVLFDASGLSADVQPVRLPIKPGTQPLGDIPVPIVARALRDMTDGEERYFWVPPASGTAPLLRVMLYHTDVRAQLAPPADLGHPPTTAKAAADGVKYVVLARGTGEPPVRQDQVVVDLSVWSETGRTVDAQPGAQSLVSDFSAALPAQLVTMRTGEHRRIWMPAAAADRYAEGGHGAVAELTLRAIHRNVDLLPDHLTIVLAGDGLIVRRGGARAPLPAGGHALDSVKLTPDRAAVTITVEDDCDMPRATTITIAALQARLENAAALALHQRKRHADAALGFARAIALDPAFDLAYVNLASALAQAGKRPDAAHALVALGQRNPVWTAWRLADDPELAGVADEPALAFLRGAVPGHVDLGKMPVLVDPAGRFVAATVEEGSWGSGDGETRIEIVDVQTGAIAATIPRVLWDYMTQPMTPAIQAEIAKSKAHAEQLLDGLGFAPPAAVEAIVPNAQDKYRGVFKRAKLGLILAEGAVRVVQNNNVLVEAPPVDGHIQAAFWVPGARLVVVYYGRAGHEGCEGTDPQGVAVIRVP
jgi:hypothetical protein